MAFKNKNTIKRKTVQIKVPQDVTEFLRIKAIKDKVFFQEELDNAVSTFIKSFNRKKKPSFLPTVKGSGDILNLRLAENLFISGQKLSDLHNVSRRSFFYTAIISYCKGKGYVP